MTPPNPEPVAPNRSPPHHPRMATPALQAGSPALRVRQANLPQSFQTPWYWSTTGPSRCRCVRRSLSSSSVCLFVIVYFVVRALTTPALCALLRIRACNCAVNFMLNFVYFAHACSIQISFCFVLWLSILLKFIWHGHHHPRRVLVASNRPPFVLCTIHI